MNQRHWPISLAAMSVSLAMGLSSQVALAQDDAGYDGGDPIVIDRKPERHGLHIAPIETTLTLEGVYQQDHISSGGEDTSIKQWVFTQQLDLSTVGYYIHPNLFEFSIDLGLGLAETYIDTDAGSSNSIGPIYSWDISATFLRNGDWPLTVYSHRDQGWTFIDFGPSLETVTTVTGAALDHRQGVTDNHLEASHTDGSVSGDGDFTSYDYTQDQISWYTTARLTPNQTLDLSYNFLNYSESGFTDNAYQQQNAAASHQALFGDDKRSSLTSTVNYTQQDGDAQAQQFNWIERLTLQHTKDLRTYYGYNYNHSEINGATADQNRAAAGFTHNLYRSLVTTGNIGVQQTTGSNGLDSTREFADIDWEYTKQVPYGTLVADLGFGYIHEDNGDAGAIDVVRQPQTFNDPLPIVLTGVIDPSTIVLTDPSGFTYVPGIDYNVLSFADHVEIERIIGGRIAPNQTVLIDYTQGPQGASTVDNNLFNTGLRYTFDKGPLTGLTLFTRYSRLDQSVESTSPNIIDNSFSDWIYGTEYVVGGLTLGAERQEHESDILPFDADRLYARLDQQRGDTNYSLNAAYTQISYPIDDNMDKLYTLSARVEHRFNTRLSGIAAVMWVNEDNDFFGQTQGFQEQLRLNWNFRQVSAFIEMRASQLDTEAADTRFEFFRVGVSRKF